MKKDGSLFAKSPTEAEMRQGFIELDVKAKTLGGVANLFTEHQYLYVRYGYATGFLSEEEALELAEQLGLRLREV